MRSAALIYNPKAGRQRGAATLSVLAAALEGAGFAVEPMATRAAGHATDLAREAAKEKEAVFALGGDGTLREAAEGLLGTGVPLGPLPGGTTNVLVRALGLPLSPLKVAREAGNLLPRRLDAGDCSGELFLMMASFGLDACVMERQSPLWKARLGRLAVALRGVSTWWSYGFPELVVDAEGERLAGTFVVLSNVHLYGGSFKLAPEALYDDGLLDLLVFQGKRGATLAFARDLALGRHLRRKDVEIRTVKRASITAVDPAAAQIDGDCLAGRRRWEVSLREEELLVLAPPTPAP